MGRGAGGQRAATYWLDPPAGGRAWRRPRRAPWSCSRRHAWLLGRRCRRRRKGRGGPSADLCLEGDLLSPLPPWAHPHLLFSLHVFTPVPSRAWPSRQHPNPRPQRAPRRPVPAMSLLFWDRSASAALSPPREARSPGAARSLPQPPAARLGPLLGGRGGGLERGAATPEDSGVAKTWRPREPEGPAGAGAKEPQTCSRKEAKPGAFPLPPLTLPAPEAAHGLAVGPQCPEEPGGGEMLLNGLLEVPIKIMFTTYFGYLTTETCTE